jgi:hypothetical protein
MVERSVLVRSVFVLVRVGVGVGVGGNGNGNGNGSVHICAIAPHRQGVSRNHRFGQGAV